MPAAFIQLLRIMLHSLADLNINLVIAVQLQYQPQKLKGNVKTFFRGLSTMKFSLKNFAKIQIMIAQFN